MNGNQELVSEHSLHITQQTVFTKNTPTIDTENLPENSREKPDLLYNEIETDVNVNDTEEDEEVDVSKFATHNNIIPASTEKANLNKR